MDRPLELKCGQCQKCRLRRAQEWACRIMHEAAMHKANGFLTLTYSEDELPEDGGLDKSHFQGFMKRLRERLGKARYYMCGEYGDDGNRPHYHACLFGHDFVKDRVPKRYGKYPLFKSPLLDELWGHGHCWVADLTPKNAAYVARYVMKKQTGNGAAETYGDLQPPYSSMSLKPGIGQSWFERYGHEVFPADSVLFEGRLVPPPRFYLNQLNEDDQDVVKARRKKAAARLEKDNTPERLRTIEACTESRVARLRRELHS